MKRRLLFAGVVGVMMVVSTFALQGQQPLTTTPRPLGERGGGMWASKGAAEPVTAALVLELGMQDSEARDWSGRAVVSGARVVRREGYRFRSGDRLLGTEAWQAQSHGPQPVTPLPLGERGEGGIGIVMHLQEAALGAAMAIEITNLNLPKVNIPIGEVIGGKAKKLWNGAGQLRLISTALPVELNPITRTEDDFPAAAYGPDGTLWAAYISYKVRDNERRGARGEGRGKPEGREAWQADLSGQPADFKSYFMPDFADQLVLKYYRDGVWSEPIRLTSDREDLVRCGVAVTGAGEVCVVYSANRGGNHDLYMRSLQYLQDGKLLRRAEVSVEQRLTTQPGADLTPVMCTDRAGNLWLACQSWNDKGQAGISILRYVKGRWQVHGAIQGDAGENCWHPAIAADNTGTVAVAYDIYRDGNYDVFVSVFDIDSGHAADYAIATSSRFEARPSIAFRNSDLWVAYELGPEKWGKDYGGLGSNDGNPLYNERSVRVMALQGANAKRRLVKPVATLPTSRCQPPQLPFDAVKTNEYERATRAAYPQLGVDLKGRLWLTYRLNFGSRYSSDAGAFWDTFARRLDGAAWTDSIELHHSDGLLDHRPVLLPHRNGGLLAIHNCDGRYTTPEVIDNQIYASVLDVAGEPHEPKVEPAEPEKRAADLQAAAEREAVARVRKYRIDSGGKRYQILRGEFHRHTELSFDGAADGSLEDMFRYAVDAASLDWIGNADHDSGAGREYSWWLIQKFTDAYHAPGVFTPMFAYERSVPYPHGHRNCMFARRGIRTLPRLAAAKDKEKAAGIHADDTKMLYRYLRELDGICAVHTSATSMGTDWRDNDAAVEPVVAVGQAFQRAGSGPLTPVPLPQGERGRGEGGFLNLALEKGYRFGFQAPGDHWSTHISYFMVLAEKNDRDGILDAVKKRHVYGATDNIIMDVRSGAHIMGDEFETSAAPQLAIKVIGAAPLARVDILRDSDMVATLKPQGPVLQHNWEDPQPAEGTHYYYVRALQADGEIAWASPIWITFKK